MFRSRACRTILGELAQAGCSRFRFVRLQTTSVSAPGCYFTEASLDDRVSIGNYHCSNKPDEPWLLTGSMRKMSE